MAEIELNSAISAGDLEKVTELLEFLVLSGESSDDDKLSQYKLLSNAVKSQQSDIVKLLLDKGFPFFAQNDDDAASPLHIAIRNNDLSIVKYLLNAGVDANVKECIKENDSTTYIPALSEAVQRQRDQIVELLLDAGADANIPYRETYTPIIEAALSGNLKIIELLMSNGANAYHKGGPYGGMNALCCAVKRGHSTAVELMLLLGVDPNVGRPNALYGALTLGNAQTIDCLLEYGARADLVNASRSNLGSALHLAAKNCQTDYIQKFYGENINFNVFNVRGETPLHFCAASTGDNALEAVKLLLKYGSNLEATNLNEESPLFYAAKNPNGAALLEYFVSRGADLTRIDLAGNNVVRVACENYREENVRILIRMFARMRVDARVPDAITSYITSQPVLNTYFDNCHEELRRMVNHSDVLNVYQLLEISNLNRFMPHARNEMVVDFVRTNFLTLMYPAHSDLIERFVKNFWLCHQKLQLMEMERPRAFFSRIRDAQDRRLVHLPMTCEYLIFSLLSLEDLLTLQRV